MAVWVMLNNFMHDFSAAGWLFGTLLLWIIIKRDWLKGSSGSGPIVSLTNVILRLMRYSLAGIVIFGVIRALAYGQYEWNEAAGEAQITLLIVKHVILTIVFVFGVIYYYRARKALERIVNAQ